MWDDAWLYELENADDPEFDLGFWSALVRRLRPRRVLELACGTGRLTLPLARVGVEVVGDGFSIVGLDSSRAFVGAASSRLASEPEAVRAAASFVEGDMREPAIEGTFDLVLVPFNSLAYLIEPADRAAALRAARSCLADDGRFAFDLLAPRYDLLAEATTAPPVVRMDADHAAPALGVERFIRTSTDTYDPTTQTLSAVNRYEIHRTDGTVEHRVTDLDWHIWFPAELELALTAAGFGVAERFGGYSCEPWTKAARRMLWLCTAR
jgi:SAM-dependent methyltransferase